MTTQKAFKKGSDFPPYSPGTIRLYSMRWCPYAQRARLVLEHKNIKYEVVNINLKEKPEWYIKDINPLGKVPCLQMDDKIVFESGVVSTYIDELYPHNKLTPADPYERARDAMFMEIYGKVISAFYKLFFNKDPAKIPEIGQDIQTSLEPVEEELQKRNTPFYGGEEPTMVDFMMWPHMERLNAAIEIFPALKLDKTKCPRLFSWVEKMLQVRAVKATVCSIDFYKTLYKQVDSGSVDYDLGLEE